MIQKVRGGKAADEDALLIRSVTAENFEAAGADFQSVGQDLNDRRVGFSFFCGLRDRNAKCAVEGARDPISTSTCMGFYPQDRPFRRFITG